MVSNEKPVSGWNPVRKPLNDRLDQLVNIVVVLCNASRIGKLLTFYILHVYKLLFI